MRFSPSGGSPFSIVVIFTLLSLIGLALLPKLSVQLFPTSESSFVTIDCTLPNAHADVLNSEITLPLEGCIAQIKGVSDIRSYAGSGQVSVRAKLDHSIETDFFRLQLASRLRQLYPQLPEGTSYPRISMNKAGAATQKERKLLLGFYLTGPGSPRDIATFATDYIRPVLSKIPGIAEVEISGTDTPILRVEMLPKPILSDKPGIEEVKNALYEALNSQSMGVFENDAHRLAVKKTQLPQSLEALHKLPVLNKNKTAFRLDEIAKIYSLEPELESILRVNGSNAVYVGIKAHRKVNTLIVAGTVRDQIEEIKPLLAIHDHQLFKGFDSTEVVEQEIQSMTFRTLIAVFILLSFLVILTKNGRYIVIVSAGILVNLLLSVFLIYLLDIEIHVYSLAGITISLGLIIDNSVIIIEEIRLRQRNEIFGAILTSTMIALGALAVIFLLPRDQGGQLYDFGLIIIVVLITSLPVAYYFIPSLLSLYPVRTRAYKYNFSRFRLYAWRAYENGLIALIRFRVLIFLLLILLFGIPIYLLPYKLENAGELGKKYNAFMNYTLVRALRPSVEKLFMGVSGAYHQAAFFTSSQTEEKEGNSLSVYVSMATGATVAQTQSVMDDLESYLPPFENCIDYYLVEGNSSGGQLTIYFNKDAECPLLLKEILEKESIKNGSAKFSITGQGLIFSNNIPLTNPDHRIKLAGYNYEQLNHLTLEIQAWLSKNPRVKNMTVSAQENVRLNAATEYVMRIGDTELLERRNSSWEALNNSLRDRQANASIVGHLTIDSEQLTHVEVTQNQNIISSLWDFLNVDTRFGDSTVVRFSSLGSIQAIKTDQLISRANQQYLLYLHYKLIGSSDMSALLRERLQDIISPQLPHGYTMNLRIGPPAQNETPDYTLYILIVLASVFFSCAILFNSIRLPLSVIAFIPFSFIGVFAILLFYELGFGAGGYASLLVLAAIVVTPPLYIINDYNGLRDRKGASSKKRFYRAFVQSLNRRIMPILTTILAGVLSLIPFLISGDEQGFWLTMSAGTIGGMLFSLLGIFVLLPICLLPKVKK